MSYPLQQYLPNASELVYGCMGLGGGWNDNAVSRLDVEQAQRVIDTALEVGINVFDHADIYTFTKAEQAFGRVLQSNPSLRERMIIQSKCGIRFADESGPKRYDFSAKWLCDSVDGILQRLHIEQLDILLLHRPDPLMELAETANALNSMFAEGKFAHLGVSNMSVAQMAFLQSALAMPIIVNQVELGLHQTALLEQQLIGNMSAHTATNTFTGLLEHAQLNQIQLPAWGALSQGRYSRPQNGHEQAVHTVLQELARRYDAPLEAVQLAFLTRHPVGIQPVIGTTNLDRIRECSKLANVILHREDWYSLLQATRGAEVP
jgi:predicted oxidoreductase